jgi:hypothetical protein
MARLKRKNWTLDFGGKTSNFWIRGHVYGVSKTA